MHIDIKKIELPISISDQILVWMPLFVYDFNILPLSHNIAASRGFF